MKDNVNHPSHYTSHPSGIEAIEITQHYNFCVGNAIKYLWRAGLKEDAGMLLKRHKTVEDLKKAVWYIQREISNIENGVYNGKNQQKQNEAVAQTSGSCERSERSETPREKVAERNDDGVNVKGASKSTDDELDAARWYGSYETPARLGYNSRIIGCTAREPASAGISGVASRGCSTSKLTPPYIVTYNRGAIQNPSKANLDWYIAIDNVMGEQTSETK